MTGPDWLTSAFDRAEREDASLPDHARPFPYCQKCCSYGKHTTSGHPPPRVVPDCQEYARFDNLADATRLMDGMVEEFRSTWRVMKHDEHFHVVEAS